MARRKPRTKGPVRKGQAPVGASPPPAPVGEGIPLTPALGWGLATVFLVLFLAQGLAFIAANSQTSDEAVHLTAGYSYLTRHDFRLNPEHPPLIKELAALSVYLRFGLPFEPAPRLWAGGEQWRIGRDFLYGSSIPAQQILTWGRLPNLLLGALLVGLIGWWAFRLWGWGAALLGMGLASLEPNLVAHSSLVTTDLGAALFGFLTVYLLWEYTRAASWRLLLALGAALGLALASKYSSILLPGILGGVLFLHLLAGGEFRLPGRERGKSRKTFTRRALAGLPPVLVLLAVAALILSSAYLFHGYSDWWVGMERVISHREVGHQAFFWGDYSSQGWLSYFPVAFLIKTPIGILALLAASLIFFRAGVKLTGRDLLFLLIPVVTLFVATAFGRINIGLRHVLPIYPFLLVITSRFATLRFRRPRFAPLLLFLGLAATGVSSLRVAPYQLAYFNELVGGPGEGYRYLSDSNIDWGQGLLGLREFMVREGIPMIYLSYFGNAPPEALGIRYQYVPSFGHLSRPGLDTVPKDAGREILAVSVCSLQAVHYEDKNLYRWLYRRTPIEKIGYAIYLYDITGDAEAHLRLAQVYLEVGPRRLAIPELEKVLALEPDHPEARRLLERSSSGG